MSRAFVDEDSEHQEELPEIPQSHNPGYITPTGYHLLQRELERIENVERPPLVESLESGGADSVEAEVRLARLDQRIHYLHARIGRAILINPADAPSDHVHFGSIVTVRDPSDHEMVVHIVGEDETDPDAGKVSCFSPLAKALMSKAVGDVALWHRPIGDVELNVINIEQPPPEE
ncbi:MAG: GreA/GreB family elongation factor [bacterium]|nr:GreA/GreB family elongation factor [Candidatus Kapabacteria bacterium]